MAFVVIYDANVLYPNLLRDLLIRVAQRGLVQARWTERILDEVFDKLTANRPDLDVTRLARTRELMNDSIRDVLVEGYEPLIEAVNLPDEDDRHVVAAAIRAHAQMIVTINLRDFPIDELGRWNLEAKHPDDFLVDQFHLDAIDLQVIVQQIADDATRPYPTFADNRIASDCRDCPRRRPQHRFEFAPLPRAGDAEVGQYRQQLRWCVPSHYSPEVLERHRPIAQL